MTDPTARIPDRADEDRVVSRRVDHPTRATPEDERAYAAADPDPSMRPDEERGGEGGTTDRAAHEVDTDASGPTRSE